MTPQRRVEGANYFISMSDLLVGMLFMFIVLLMIAQVAAGEKIDELDRQNRLRVEARHALMQRLVDGLRGAEVIKEDGVIRFPAGLLFAENDDRPQPGARTILAELARRMERELPCFGASQDRARCPGDGVGQLEAVYIEGHTDNFRPRRRFADNWELSSARAIQTYKIMQEAAPRLTRIRNASRTATMLGISAYADTRPTASEPISAGLRSEAYGQWREANRRIEFRFLLAAHREGQ